MSNINPATEGLIELLEDVSHDPDQTDFYDVKEYIESLPNPYNTLYEFAKWVHGDLL